MEQLIEQMKIILGTNFGLYFKAHTFHWNVEGPNFAEYHNFLGAFYEAVYEQTDAIAEHIRALDSYTPTTLARMIELSKIDELVARISHPFVTRHLVFAPVFVIVVVHRGSPLGLIGIGKQRQQAAALDIARNLYPSRFEKGRGVVDVLDQLLHALPGFDLRGPANDKGHL